MAIHQSHVANPEFYFSCAQIRVTGSGTGNPGPLVKIPGMYNLRDPAFNFNIYYPSPPRTLPPTPGPPVWNGAAGNGGGSTPPPTTPPPSNGGGGGSCSALYGQCGGRDYNGPKCCSAGTCKVTNEWYSQCV